jgi:3D (Asp-Asp-Asp) domain-containing protein
MSNQSKIFEEASSIVKSKYQRFLVLVVGVFALAIVFSSVTPGFIRLISSPSDGDRVDATDNTNESPEFSNEGPESAKPGETVTVTFDVSDKEEDEKPSGEGSIVGGYSSNISSSCLEFLDDSMEWSTDGSDTVTFQIKIADDFFGENSGCDNLLPENEEPIYIDVYGQDSDGNNADTSISITVREDDGGPEFSNGQPGEAKQGETVTVSFEVTDEEEDAKPSDERSIFGGYDVKASSACVEVLDEAQEWSSEGSGTVTFQIKITDDFFEGSFDGSPTCDTDPFSEEDIDIDIYGQDSDGNEGDMTITITVKNQSPNGPQFSDEQVPSKVLPGEEGVMLSFEVTDEEAVKNNESITGDITSNNDCVTLGTGSWNVQKEGFVSTTVTIRDDFFDPATQCVSDPDAKSETVEFEISGTDEDLNSNSTTVTMTVKDCDCEWMFVRATAYAHNEPDKSNDDMSRIFVGSTSYSGGVRTPDLKYGSLTERGTAAVDPDVIPYGSVIKMRDQDGNMREFTANDTGGAVRSRKAATDMAENLGYSDDSPEANAPVVDFFARGKWSGGKYTFDSDGIIPDYWTEVCIKEYDGDEPYRTLPRDKKDEILNTPPDFAPEPNQQQNQQGARANNQAPNQNILLPDTENPNGDNLPDIAYQDIDPTNGFYPGFGPVGPRGVTPTIFESLMGSFGFSEEFVSLSRNIPDVGIDDPDLQTAETSRNLLNIITFPALFMFF